MKRFYLDYCEEMVPLRGPVHPRFFIMLACAPGAIVETILNYKCSAVLVCYEVQTLQCLTMVSPKIKGWRVRAYADLSDAEEYALEIENARIPREEN